ncbi:MAG: tetratricopeptide repeat protein [Myxococcota bacterium]|jgi:tetratricopeptide (TPR) repeat protein|nr:tetratricopeptide repeat protein [Myxococcota bacterium]
MSFERSRESFLARVAASAMRLPFMTFAALGLTALLVLPPLTSWAASNTDEAYKLLRVGQYDAAERLFQSELGKESDNPRAVLGLARIYELTGRETELAEQLEKAKSYTDFASLVKTMQAESLIRQGQYKEAKKQLEKLLDADPGAFRAMIALGRLHYLLGKKNDGDRIMNSFAQVYNSGKAKTAEELTYVGIAMFMTESYRDAEMAFLEAVEADSKYVEAYVERGFNFLEKYNQRDADESFAAALEVDPSFALALLGRARACIDSNHDFICANTFIDQALAVNPKLVDAILLRAEMRLMLEQVDEALALIDEALVVNPKHLRALSLKAAAFYLDDREKEVKKVEKEVLAINPRYAEFYAILATYAELAHRYSEVLALYEKAIETDKSYWKAFVGLGIAYTRVGDDKKAYELLEKAFEADSYNVRAYNMVQLLYDDTFPHYELLETPLMRYRFHRDERELLELYVPPLMEGVYRIYSKKYGIELDAPTSIELFNDMQSFSIRSVGYPAIDPQGICFGKLITSYSPTQGNFNWALVLSHELAHSFHLALTEGRVPRWFTEGLAEYETVLARREWRRENHIQVWVALENDRLPHIQNFNEAFTNAPTMNHVILAYYLASLTLEYIDQTYGFEKIVGMLRAWGEKKKTEEVFETVLGISVEQFDTEFRLWLRKKLAYFEGSYEVDIDDFFANYELYIKNAADHPDDAEALAAAGFAEFIHMRFDNAQVYLEQAIAKNPDSPLANHLGGTLFARIGGYEQAIPYFDKLLALGKDGYTIRLDLGFLYLKKGEVEKAVEHYNKAKQFYPFGEEPYRQLATHYEKTGDDKKARPELEKLLEIDENDFLTAKRLLVMAFDNGDIKDARRYGELALDIYPFDPEVHLLLAKVAVKQEDWRFAEREYLAYLAVEPGQPFEAYLGLAEVYIQLGQNADAKDYIERAQAVRPNDPAISTVESKLKQ